MSVIVDQWRREIWNFNNRIASNLLLCAYQFNNVYKILLPVFYFLLVVIACVLFRKCLITLLKFSPKHQLRKPRLELSKKLLPWLYLAILSSYLTWCITIMLLPGYIEFNPCPKSSSRECFSIYHRKLNKISTQSFTKVPLLTAYNLIHNFGINCVSQTFLNSETGPSDPNLKISG